MELKLERIARKQSYTIGRLYVDGEYFCDTLEDTDRGLDADMPLSKIAELKKKGITAIPVGTYEITIKVVSPKFKARSWAKPYGGRVPRLLNVPGFDGVLIHPGNTAADTDGCILVGRNTVVGQVTDSVTAYMALMGLMNNKLMNNNGQITLTIE